MRTTYFFALFFVKKILFILWRFVHTHAHICLAIILRWNWVSQLSSWSSSCSCSTRTFGIWYAHQISDLQYTCQHWAGMHCASTAVLEVPRTQTAIGDRLFSIAGPWVWNSLVSLPATVRDTNSSLRFRELLKACLFIWRPWHRWCWTVTYKWTY